MNKQIIKSIKRSIIENSNKGNYYSMLIATRLLEDFKKNKASLASDKTHRVQWVCSRGD